jgi:predicted  nucleic acid-binding Zn-ribbon protein
LGQEKSLLREIEALQHLKRDLDSLSDVRQTVEEKREERKGLDTMISEVRTSLRDVKRALSATFDELEQARGETDREAIDALHAEKREVYAEIKELRKQIRDERDAYYNSLRARKEWEDRAREEEEEERKRKEEEDKVKRAEWIEQRTDELLQKDPYLQEKQACDELI